MLSLVPFLVLAIRQWGYLPRIPDGDFAQYILHAKALVEGRPYTATGYIFTQYGYLIGPLAQPPGLPLTLAPLVALFGANNLAILKSVVIIAALLFAIISGRYFAAREGIWLGAGVALMTAFSLEAQHATISVLADLPFCAVCWWLISVADRAEVWTTRRALGIAALGVLAVSFRIAGAALGPAVVLYALMRPRGERRTAFLPAVIWGVGALIALLAVSDLVPFAKQILRSPTISGKRLMEFGQHAEQGVISALLYPFTYKRANDLLHAVLLVPLGIGLLRFLVRWCRTFVWAFTVAYVVMLLIAPVQESRYLWPLYPVLFFALFDGIVWTCHVIRVPWPDNRMRHFAFGVMAAIAVVTLVREIREGPPPSLLGHPDARTLFQWLKKQGEFSPRRVVFVNPRVLTLATGVPAMAPIFARTENVLLELERRKITDVVVGDLGEGLASDSTMRRVIAEAPRRFESEFQNRSFAVYAFLRQSGTTGTLPR